jgi:hypothetical protein
MRRNVPETDALVRAVVHEKLTGVFDQYADGTITIAEFLTYMHKELLGTSELAYLAELLMDRQRAYARISDSMSREELRSWVGYLGREGTSEQALIISPDGAERLSFWLQEHRSWGPRISSRHGTFE